MNDFNPIANRAAAQWKARMEQGLSAAEQRDFEQWLERDPAHIAAFDGVEEVWSNADALKFSRYRAALESELKHLPRRRARSGSTGLARWFTVAGLAAAAALAIGYVTWYRPNYYSEAIGTGVGQIQHLALPDGSSVQVNTQTTVSIEFSPTFRRVHLQSGEALFTVAKDADRPFVVMANGVDVRAIGTAFGVRVREQTVEVLVTHGKVQVADPESVAANVPNAPKQLLVAGERAIVSRSSLSLSNESPGAEPILVAPVTPEEIDRSLAWREARLVFVGVPLGEIAAEFNRYNARKIVVADRELAQRKFGGTFDATDPKTLVELLRTSYEVQVRETDDAIVLRSEN